MIRSAWFTAWIAVLALALPLAAPARAEMPTDAEMESLFVAAKDSLRAADAEYRLRRLMLEVPPPLVGMFREIVLQSLQSRRAPSPDLIGQADTMIADTTVRLANRLMFVGHVENELLERRERLGWVDSVAHAYVRRARTAGDPNDLDFAISQLARVFRRTDRLDSAVTLLASYAAKRPDAGWLHEQLGYTYLLAHRYDDAIEQYVIAHGSQWADTSISEGLREAWTKRHENLDGLAERVAAAREARHHHAVFEVPKMNRAAPAWSLPTLDGLRRTSREFAGRVLVIDFWGTWCPGCVEGLPDFVEVSRDTAFRAVTFLTINCEKREWGRGDPRERVAALMREKGWDFPVVQDTTTRTQTAFGVKAFPTVIVVDRAGRVRFADLADPHGHPMLREQLAMLLAEKPSRRRQ